MDVVTLCLYCLYEWFDLFLRLQQLDEENSELRSCVPCLRANIERLEEVRATPPRLLLRLAFPPAPFS